MIADRFKLTHYANPEADHHRAYPEILLETLSKEAADEAYEEISGWPEYAVSPLHSLSGLAAQIGVERIWYKDEGNRFGLGSFKALGGAYAVFVQIRRHIKGRTGKVASIRDLLDKRYAGVLQEVVFTSATAGNHGRSVAWGARLFGCRCVIYIHRLVSAERESAIAAEAAQIVRVDGNYDDSVRQAAADARAHGRILVADTSHAGYVEIPRIVGHGYTVMVREIVDQLDGRIPTCLFRPASVDSLRPCAAISGSPGERNVHVLSWSNPRRPTAFRRALAMALPRRCGAILKR